MKTVNIIFLQSLPNRLFVIRGRLEVFCFWFCKLVKICNLLQRFTLFDIKNLLQFTFQFQTASYKPSVYVESESSHRPSGSVWQCSAAVRGVQRESR